MYVCRMDAKSQFVQVLIFIDDFHISIAILVSSLPKGPLWWSSLCYFWLTGGGCGPLLLLLWCTWPGLVVACLGWRVKPPHRSLTRCVRDMHDLLGDREIHNSLCGFLNDSSKLVTTTVK